MEFEEGSVCESIGYGALGLCTTLTNLIIPNSVTSIGDCAFVWCTSLTSVTIPNSVTSIGDSAFEGCSSLKSVTIGNGLTSIGGAAFEDCSSLTSINIPNTITSIGNSVFDGCVSLTYNEYDNAYYLGNDTNPYVLLVKAKDKSITSCLVNANAKFIYTFAFSGCSSLTSITIPNSVTSIGASAFYT